MTTRRSILFGSAIVAGAALWYRSGPGALTVGKAGSEPLPAAEHAMSSMADSAGMAHSGSMTAQSPAMAQSGSSMPESPAMARSAMAADEPVKVVSGRFHTNAHKTDGLATIYRLADGRRVLRLTQFATSNGPDVRVYHVAAGDVQDEGAAKQAGFLDLGALKGNIGDQNYDVRADIDLSKYRAVCSCCRQISVNYGVAALAETM